ncbi:hypothetical protein KP509_14G091900 [Ceratopteris richardii]|uniref:Hexosyltransferase n=2 Tax=Ceratopteris richardii TaxID=49495 RepID=A0A8T2TCF1_CERRI|nr:hypothetical protein KP509_14G091900 [Ceratopteris richardii]KAH7416449.1 hypothetical protein KP509_14G091900 [Ceratopteris richardii]
MPSKRGNGNSRSRAGKFRIPVLTLLLVSVVAPLIFLASRLGNFALSGDQDSSSGLSTIGDDDKRLNALQQIENLFSNDVLKVITTNSDDSGPLSLNVVGRKDLSASWVVEKPADLSRYNNLSKAYTNESNGEDKYLEVASTAQSRGSSNGFEDDQHSQMKTEYHNMDEADLNEHNIMKENDTSEQAARLQLRLERKDKRASDITQIGDETDKTSIFKEAFQVKKEIDDNILHKYSIWGPDFDADSESLIRLVRDQVIMARVYESLARSHNMPSLQRELNVRMKESSRLLAEANVDADLPSSATEKIKAMGQTLSIARRYLYDCKAVARRLRAMVQAADDQADALTRQSTVLRQLLAKTTPKGLHCLSMLLTSEFLSLSEDQKIHVNLKNLEDPSLYHYALFSDNVIAAAVVVNSTIQNAKEQEKHVFHIVSDKLNFAAMKMWFIANPPGKATVHVENIDDFKWLNATYCPVLRQLETSSMKEYYFKSDHSTTLADAATNLKYRNPKYLSMLNHLRFYLPEVYPKLDKILFLDDDIVVQKDLASLWAIDLHGNVNGAVETCGKTFHRFDKYLNFSNPLIYSNFDSNACGWAYGMNMFDLKEWKRRNITSIYHKWQTLNEQRELWKLGTLPPGLITFYNLTYPLEKSWHVLGLGYDPHIEQNDIENAAVVHYNGNMKPWLDLSFSKYKTYWAKYLDQSNIFLQQCNVNV